MYESWHTYPRIYALGHRALADLLQDPVLIEEKIDGSQFSFGRFGDEFKARSKGAVLNDPPEKMFAAGFEVAKALPLTPGWTYRAEYLAKPKHNALAYDRIPRQHLAIFDINDGHESYLSYDAKAAEAERLGLEVAPRLYEGVVVDLDTFRRLLDTPSFLGGQRVEGVVVKNYARYGLDTKVLMGKFVSEAFKEVHAGEWKIANPKQGDIVELLTERYRTPARWAKAVQHLRECGGLEGSPRDIGLLFKEVPADLEKECRDEMLDAVWTWLWPKVRRGVTAGLAEWYKERLLEAQFTSEDTNVSPTLP